VKRVLLGGLCLLVVVLSASAQSDAHKKATSAYLQTLQSDDGGFRASAAAKESDLPATTSAFRALRYFGGAPRDKDACAAFVRKCFDKDSGGFAARPGGKAAYRPTAVGIMAVVDLKMPTEPYAEAVIKYLDANSKTFMRIAPRRPKATSPAGWANALRSTTSPAPCMRRPSILLVSFSSEPACQSIAT
jgi:hypothetical protein